jgi:hypothetical protein
VHPRGIEFGLAYNLLQFHGDHLVLSDNLLNLISEAARRQLRGKRIDGGDLLERVITRGLSNTKVVAVNAKRGAYVSFLMKIDQVVWDTIFLYAERAGIGYRTGRKFYLTRTFRGELLARKAIWRRAGEACGHQKILFMACYEAVRAGCEKAIPEDSHHAELLALLMWKVYEHIFEVQFLEMFSPE